MDKNIQSPRRLRDIPGDLRVDPLDGTTWKVSTQTRATPARARLPCLTVLAHPDVSRVGERAVLRELRVRQCISISRLQPLFEPLTGGDPRALADRYLSRTPLRLEGDARSELTLRCSLRDVRCDGRPVEQEQTLRAADLERGVLLELSGRVALLLHYSEASPVTSIDGLLGHSDAIERVRRDIRHAADFATPVLIRGETGSGKECVARALHACSPRAEGPYVAVNMATVTESMAVSLLFGHTRGAFTGATQAHRGLFEQAHQGTLFLDEIGETPSSVQPMLLRALETGRISALGGGQEREVDVRVIAATDADLEQRAEGGAFRKALFHRLAAFQITLPPLRERPEDVLPLFVHFLRQELHRGDQACLQPRLSDPRVPLPPEIARALLGHDFAGNVRELRNLARRVAVASRGQGRLVFEAVLRELGTPATASTAPHPARAQQTPEPGRRRTPDAVPDDAELVAALEAHGWSVSRAASALELPTSTLHDLIRRCPHVRRAKDVPDDELVRVQRESGGDLRHMARTLRVSERALKMTLRARGLLERASG